MPAAKANTPAFTGKADHLEWVTPGEVKEKSPVKTKEAMVLQSSKKSPGQKLQLNFKPLIGGKKDSSIKLNLKLGSGVRKSENSLSIKNQGPLPSSKQIKTEEQ